MGLGQLDNELGQELVGNIHCFLGSWGHCIWDHRRQCHRSWLEQVLDSIGVDGMRGHCMVRD